MTTFDLHKRIKTDQFLRIALILAESSHCISHKVAAIAVQNGRIVATGINGSLPGQPNCDDVFNDVRHIAISSDLRKMHHEWSNVHEVHAEQNLVAVAAKSGIVLQGATIFSTLEPCMHCAKILAAAGVSVIIYKDKYDKAEGESISYLRSYGIQVEQGVIDA